MRARFALAALLLATVTGGCGKELVVGGQKHVESTGTGDATPDGAASKAPAYARAPADGRGLTVAGRAQGTLTFDARVEVGTAGGAFVPLSPAPAIGVTVRIDGSDSGLIAAGDVPVGSYTTVRVTFTRVQANVTGGLTIGGTNVTGLVSVALPPGGVVVERAVDLGSPSASVGLLVDLDASDGLGTASLDTRLVAATTFRDAVKLRTY